MDELAKDGTVCINCSDRVVRLYNVDPETRALKRYREFTDQIEKKKYAGARFVRRPEPIFQPVRLSDVLKRKTATLTGSAAKARAAYLLMCIGESGALQLMSLDKSRLVSAMQSWKEGAVHISIA